ncbi:MAG: hypothetical protein V1921_00010 [Candidatus Altiarchaeota archaeon]
MKNRGIIYTLVTVVMIMMFSSLIQYYITVSRPKIETMITNIQTDELHYFIESIKEDFERSARITAQRAMVYLSGYIMDQPDTTGFVNVRNYQMVPPSCSDIVYKPDGVQAAMAELMLCNTLFGSSAGVAEYMENNTLFNWTANISRLADENGYVAQMRLFNVTIRPFGPYNMLIVGEIEASLRDKSNLSFFVGNITASSMVSLQGFSDPLYDVLTGRPELIAGRDFTPCNMSGTVDYQRVDEWINQSCYFNSSSLYLAPTFFNRMEGNLDPTNPDWSKYYAQADEMAVQSGLEDIRGSGLESIADLDLFSEKGVAVNKDNTWVDYLYWQNVPGQCWANNMPSYHQDFRIDRAHALNYGIQGVYCGGVRICGQTYWCGKNDGVNPDDFGANCEYNYVTASDPDSHRTPVCDGTLVPFACNLCPNIPGVTDCCAAAGQWDGDNLVVLY